VAKKKSTIRKSIRIDGRPTQKRFTNAEDAAEWYAIQLRMKKRVEAGLEESLEPNLMTTKQYAKLFMKRRVQDELVVKGTWVSDEQRLVDYIFPLVGDDVFQSIKPKRWSEVFDLIQKEPLSVLGAGAKRALTDEEQHMYLEKIRRGRKPLSNSTRNKIRTLVHTMYEEAIKVDKIAFQNPIAQVDVKDEGDPESKSDFWETKEECEAYLAGHAKYAQERNFYAYYLWAVCSMLGGSRVGELLALKHQDFKLDQMRVRLNKIYDPYVKADVQRTKGSRKSKTKGRKRASRWLHLTPQILEAYKIHVQHTRYNALTDHVFMNTRDSEFAKIKNQGNRITVWGIERVHDKVCELTKLRRIRVHDVRHTYGAHFMMSGGDLTTLSKILGHSNAWTTERYGHLSESHVAREVGRVAISTPENVAKRDATVMPSDANATREAGGSE
jgi:integrase